MGDFVPVIEQAIEPSPDRSLSDLASVLEQVECRYGSFVVKCDEEPHHIILQAEDERQLELLVNRARKDIGEELRIGAPMVSYRETLRSAVEIEYVHKVQDHGKGEFAALSISFQPGRSNTGVTFVNGMEKDAVPLEFVRAIESGIRTAAQRGNLIGYPVIGFEAKLTGAKYHDTDSSSLAFEVAAQEAFRNACVKSGISLLQPVMQISVGTDQQWTAFISQELIARGLNLEVKQENRRTEFSGSAPMANLFGLRDRLNDLCSSDGELAMQLVGFVEIELPIGDPEDTEPASMALRA